MARIKVQPNRQLAFLIAELLDTDLRTGTKVLRAVLQSIKNAMLMGDKVYIRGFGTFKVVDRTHKPTPNNILTSKGRGPSVNGRHVFSSGLCYYKPRQVVIFEPSIPLMGMLNMDSPNYKERRAQDRWTSSKGL